MQLVPCPKCGSEARVFGNCGEPKENFWAACVKDCIEVDIDTETPAAAALAWNAACGREKLGPEIDAIWLSDLSKLHET